MNGKSLKKYASVLILCIIVVSQVGCHAKRPDTDEPVSVVETDEEWESAGEQETDTQPAQANSGAYRITQKERMNDGLHLSNDATRYSQLEQMIDRLMQDIRMEQSES